MSYTPGLTPIQHLAVKYIAGGWSTTRVSQELKLSPNIIKKWRSADPVFMAALQTAIAHHSELVEAMLMQGEAAAAKVLIDALSADNKLGPNWNVRVQAAVTLLDRAGQRGRAIERQQVAVATMKGGVPDVEDALRRALRDPGVRQWLKEAGATASLAAMEDGDIVVIESNDPITGVSTPLLGPVETLDAYGDPSSEVA